MSKPFCYWVKTHTLKKTTLHNYETTFFINEYEQHDDINHVFEGKVKNIFGCF